MTEEQNKLAEPCPFCGSKVMRENAVENTGGNRRFIWCANCSAQGPWSMPAASAMKLWNDRVEREPATEAVLAQFGDWVLEELRGENIGNDLDGGAAQDKAEELGILVRVPVTEPCGERCECAEYGDFPQMCLRRALKGKGASQGGAGMVMPEREALAFFVATAFGDGFFDDDQRMKERVRAWLLNSANKIREDITIEEVVESLVAASPDEQKG